MSDLRVTLPNGIELSLAQVLRIRELGDQLGAYEWHPNACGCCVTVHRRGQHGSGYVIDSDGGYDWYDRAD